MSSRVFINSTLVKHTMVSLAFAGVIGFWELKPIVKRAATVRHTRDSLVHGIAQATVGQGCHHPFRTGTSLAIAAKLCCQLTALT